MESSKELLSLLVLSVFLIGVTARAEEIQFSEEELPREAVMPRLDSPKAVINRKLSYAKRTSVDASVGWFMDEPFYNNQYFAVQGNYNWSEASGVGLKYLMFGTGLSGYSSQFASSVTPSADFSRSRGPRSGFLVNYERRMMYGKLSLSKRWVIPGYLTWGLEGGMMAYGSRQLPLAGASIANRFFLGKSLGISLTLHGYMRQFVDPLSQTLRNSPVPSETDFTTNTKFSTAMDLGINYLF